MVTVVVMKTKMLSGDAFGGGGTAVVLWCRWMLVAMVAMMVMVMTGLGHVDIESRRWVL